MDDFDFTEEEIREQLEILGYRNVPAERLQEFKKDLEQLVRHERSKNSSSSTTESDTFHSKKTNGYSSHMTESRPRTTNGFTTVSADIHITRPHIEDDDDEDDDIIHMGVASNDKSSVRVPTRPIPSHHKPEARGYDRPATSYDHAELRDFDHAKSRYPDCDEYSRPVSARYEKDRRPHIGQTSVRSENQRDYGRPKSGRRQQDESFDTTLDTTSSSQRKGMRRKVLRKVDGESHIYDESSVTESEVDDMDYIQTRLRQLPIGYDSRDERPLSGREPQSSQRKRSPRYKIEEDWRSSAFIRTMDKPPHEQNLQRVDRVNRWHAHAAYWDVNKPPHVKLRKKLIWSVKDKMLYHDEVVQKKQRDVGPNNQYVPPTDKLRKPFRWRIRQDLAQGLIPTYTD